MAASAGPDPLAAGAVVGRAMLAAIDRRIEELRQQVGGRPETPELARAWALTLDATGTEAPAELERWQRERHHLVLSLAEDRWADTAHLSLTCRELLDEAMGEQARALCSTVRLHPPGAGRAPHPRRANTSPPPRGPVQVPWGVGADEPVAVGPGTRGRSLWATLMHPSRAPVPRAARQPPTSSTTYWPSWKSARATPALCVLGSRLPCRPTRYCAANTALDRRDPAATRGWPNATPSRPFAQTSVRRTASAPMGPAPAAVIRPLAPPCWPLAPARARMAPFDVGGGAVRGGAAAPAGRGEWSVPRRKASGHRSRPRHAHTGH